MAMWRQVKGAEIGWLAALGSLTLISPTTVHWNQLNHLTSPSSLFVAVIGVWLVASGVVVRQSWRLLGAACLLLVAAGRTSAGAWLFEHHGFAAGHLLILAMLVIGGLFHDRVAQWTQRLAAVLLGIACLAATVQGDQFFGELPSLFASSYPLLIVAVAAGYGYLTRSRWFYATAAVALTASVSAFGVRGYDQLRHHIVGLGHLAWGLLCFLIAAAISVWKAGFMQQKLLSRLSRVTPHSTSGPVQNE